MLPRDLILTADWVAASKILIFMFFRFEPSFRGLTKIKRNAKGIATENRMLTLDLYRTDKVYEDKVMT